MASGPRFCPFCRECYEDVARCPEHDLPLVTFDRLSPEEGDEERNPDEAVALHDLRQGRGWLLLGAASLLGGMALPLVTVGGATESAYALATDRAINLWILVAVAGALLSIWMRRRTPAEMRGSRLAVVALALMAGGSIGYTLVRIHRASGMVGLSVELGPGAYVLFAATLVTMVAGWRLGRR
jgi:hypothetical protein